MIVPSGTTGENQEFVQQNVTNIDVMKDLNEAVSEHPSQKTTSQYTIGTSVTGTTFNNGKPPGALRT